MAILVGLTCVMVGTAPANASEGGKRQLVCRTVSSEGKMDLLLEWEGGVGKGLLEHVAPSGNTTAQRVQAERIKTMIVVDDLGQKDLVTHAAVVAEKDGKRYMRIGDDSHPWRACE